MRSRKKDRAGNDADYFRQLIEHCPDAVLIKSAEQILYANQASLRLFGAATPEDLIGTPPLDLIAPEDQAKAMEGLAPLFRGEGEAVRMEKAIQRLDGGRLDVEISAAPFSFQEETLVQAVIRDVTDRKRERLTLSRLAAIVDSSEDAILSATPDGTIVSWNPGAERLYGYTPEEILGHPLSRLTLEEDSRAVHERLQRVLRGERIEHDETTQRRKDGTLIDVSVTRAAIHDADGVPVGMAAIVRDISDRKSDERRIAAQLAQIQEYTARLEAQQEAMEAANRRLEALATTDGLTGLLNQRAFEERLAEETRRARRYSTAMGLIVLDVDRFKDYNDAFGHLAGNAVLRELAHVLRASARETDFVARFGGEEFALILPHTQIPEAVALAERLRASIERAPLDARRSVTASFGVCDLKPDTADPAALIACADAAMYRAKAEGRNRVVAR